MFIRAKLFRPIPLLNCSRKPCMKKIINYLKVYFTTVNKWVLLFSSVFTALAIYGNYHFHLNRSINRLGGLGKYTAWYFVFLIAFGYGYLLQKIFLRSTILSNKRFVQLL